MYESNREVAPTGAEVDEFVDAPPAQEPEQSTRHDGVASSEPPSPDTDERPVRGAKWARRVLERVTERHRKHADGS
jgi:hypothetical protein